MGVELEDEVAEEGAQAPSLVGESFPYRGRTQKTLGPVRLWAGGRGLRPPIPAPRSRRPRKPPGGGGKREGPAKQGPTHPPISEEAPPGLPGGAGGGELQPAATTPAPSPSNTLGARTPTVPRSGASPSRAGREGPSRFSPGGPPKGLSLQGRGEGERKRGRWRVNPEPPGPPPAPGPGPSAPPALVP